MKCQTNDTNKTIVWRAPIRDSLSSKIFSGDRISPNWSEILYVNSSLPGQYDLMINSTMSAGTQYVCQEGPHGHLDDNHGTAELVVLGGDPKCSVNMEIEDDKVKVNQENFSFKMQCIVRHSGRWTPVMEWIQERCKKPLHAEVNATVQNNTVISTVTVSTKRTCNLTRYIFTTRFDKSDKPSSTTAQNVPTYSYNWTSPTIVIANEIRVTTSSHSSTATSSTLILAIILVAAILGTLLTILLLLHLRRIVIKRKTQSNMRDTHVGTEAVILQHNYIQSVQEDVLTPSIHDSQTIPIYSPGMKRPVANEYPIIDQNPVATGQHDLYSKVNKSARVDHEQETSQRPTDPARGFMIHGADGTEYTELSSIKSPNCSRQQAPRKDLFDKSIYAKIDHTISAPPPPPQNQTFLR